jgi:hypothetical protein
MQLRAALRHGVHGHAWTGTDPGPNRDAGSAADKNTDRYAKSDTDRYECCKPIRASPRVSPPSPRVHCRFEIVKAKSKAQGPHSFRAPVKLRKRNLARCESPGAVAHRSAALLRLTGMRTRRCQR